MKNPNGMRGAALAETALVLTATLAMIFGIVQIGVIGFLQITCDGAAFVAAHEYSLGNSAYAQYAQRPFPQILTPITDLNAPDASTTAVPVAFPTASTAREGGVSLILPSHGQVTVHATAPIGLLGTGVAGLSKVDLHGTTIEPEYQLNNDVYDAGAKGYTGASAQVDFFADQENTPMYYVSQHRLLVCETTARTLSNYYTTPAISSFNSTNCPAANQVLLSLGTAEYLDQDNWNLNYPGVSVYGPSTFWVMYCHSRMFAYAAIHVFVPAATATAMPNVNVADDDYPANQTGVTTKGIVGEIYDWDYSLTMNFPTGSTTWNQRRMDAPSFCSWYVT